MDIEHANWTILSHWIAAWSLGSALLASIRASKAPNMLLMLCCVKRSFGSDERVKTGRRQDRHGLVNIIRAKWIGTGYSDDCQGRAIVET